MDAFSYLSVLLSIIIGLAIAQVLLGYRGLLLSRARVTLYAPPLIWSALILLFATQLWWASFGLADHEAWTFAAFGMVLLQTVLLYMSAALVLPDFPPREAIDLRDHYFREATPFFGVLLAMIAVSLAKDWMLEGRLPEAGNLGFHIVFAGVAVAAMLIRRPRFHAALAPAAAALSLAYVGLLFSRLD
ncbi:MAG: hypothetical protein H7X93_03540 [Sphingomonadaceae bacterium]|nr:hypothetical protein [Sphingomonadaceae bacterium]